MSITPEAVQKVAEAIRAIIPAATDISSVGELISEPTQSRFAGRHFLEFSVPEDFGIFKAIIKDCHLSAYFEECGDGRYWVMCNLSYNHTGGGSNGYEVATIWLDANDFSLIEVKLPGSR